MSGKRAAKSARPTARAAAPTVRHERLLVALLLAAHVLLAAWGAVRQSVTFDENFHLPSGILAAAQGELRVSAVNPPLVKMLAGFAALAAGARVPRPEALGSGEQGEVGLAFMRENAAIYPRMFVAGRLVIVLLSGVLAWLVWRWSRRLWGARGALLSLAAYAFAPEALAHAGVVTMDLPTALGFVASLVSWQVFVTRGRWRDWLWLALAVGFTFLVRFTAVFLPLLLVLTALPAFVRRRVRAPRRVALGFVALGASTLVLLAAGYLGKVTFAPLRDYPFESKLFQSLQQRAPGLRLPLPDLYVGGFDRQAVESQSGQTPSFLLGQLHPHMPLAYFPIALAVKLPLGFLAALLLLAALAFRRTLRLSRLLWPLSLALLFLWIGMFVGRLGIGIRYVFPIVPAFAVALGALAARRAGALWRRAALVAMSVQAVEACAHAPWHLSFFNALAGGNARAQWIVNDSNLDWGQGLIALREELHRRGITRVHLAYHGTVDPAVYGIAYVPYTGGTPGPESDWIAISSYYFVGLSQRMVTSAGRSEQPIRLDFKPLWPRTPDAMPAGCMLLFKFR